MEHSLLGSHGAEDATGVTLPAESKSFRRAQLRLLMKEREDVASKLVDLDYSIWVLEELFREAGQ